MRKAAPCIAMLVILLLNLSCSKFTVPKETKVPPATKFSEIKSSDGFDWATSRIYFISVNGLTTPKPVSATLQITTPDGNYQYYSGLQIMSQSTHLELIIPAKEDSILVQFGKIRKMYRLENDQMSIDYLPFSQ